MPAAPYWPARSPSTEGGQTVAPLESGLKPSVGHALRVPGLWEGDSWDEVNYTLRFSRSEKNVLCTSVPGSDVH